MENTINTPAYNDPANPIMMKNTTSQPLVIAGPCSAETREQVIETAAAIRQMPEVTWYRAGVWKPRTRPGGFEGQGIAALPWLQEVQSTMGLKVTVEVANTLQVEAALQAGMDGVWIGARTTVSPFAVQEIAEALKGTSIPVWVKNPVSPDLALWLGALERLDKAGIHQLSAIHRGCTPSYAPAGSTASIWRNDPHWALAQALQTAAPTLPLIIDPSHIAGKRDLVPLIVKQALQELRVKDNQNTDTVRPLGWMIETHISPTEAWSDAAQQLTPAELQSLVAHITLAAQRSRKPSQDPLYELRQEIDLLDNVLLELLAKRLNTAAKIGQIKREAGIPTYQPGRKEELYRSRMNRALALGLPAAPARTILEAVHDAAIEVQQPPRPDMGFGVL
jgi:chorismate mutase